MAWGTRIWKLLVWLSTFFTSSNYTVEHESISLNCIGDGGVHNSIVRALYASPDFRSKLQSSCHLSGNIISSSLAEAFASMMKSHSADLNQFAQDVGLSANSETYRKQNDPVMILDTVLGNVAEACDSFEIVVSESRNLVEHEFLNSLTISVQKYDSLYKFLAENFGQDEKQLTAKDNIIVALDRTKRLSRWISTSIDDFVQFPMNLDLKPFSNNCSPNNYRLYAMVASKKAKAHSDIRVYRAYIRSDNKMWYEIGDIASRKVSDSEVLSAKADILFYRK